MNGVIDNIFNTILATFPLLLATLSSFYCWHKRRHAMDAVLCFGLLLPTGVLALYMLRNICANVEIMPLVRAIDSIPREAMGTITAFGIMLFAIAYSIERLREARKGRQKK